MKLRALKPIEYGDVIVRTGEVFEAEPEDADYLIAEDMAEATNDVDEEAA